MKKSKTALDKLYAAKEAAREAYDAAIGTADEQPARRQYVIAVREWRQAFRASIPGLK